tara:strand:- start:256 stop:894 length:639 start_codon:yes stop_codon:yes gene_type:complete
MAYIQKNNPIPKTGCGRRRLSRMKNPFKKNSGFKQINDLETFEKIAKSRAKQNKMIQKDLESKGYTFKDSPKSASRGNMFKDKVKGKVKSKAAVKGTTKATKKIGAKTLSKAVRLGGRLTGMVGLGVEGAIAAQKSKAKAYREMDKRSPGTSKRLETGAYGNQDGVRGTFFGPMKKISARCKAQAKKKFKVWPSAYASGWGVRCTRGDFKKK